MLLWEESRDSYLMGFGIGPNVDVAGRDLFRKLVSSADPYML
jgi:hypothetical protein